MGYRVGKLFLLGSQRKSEVLTEWLILKLVILPIREKNILTSCRLPYF